MKEYYRVYADIDLDAIYENVKNAKALLKKDTKMMAIVKADGYGHGAVEVARQIDELVDAYGVAILEEGIELRKAGFTKPILILGYTPKPLYPAMICYDIATAVFTMEMAKEISDTAVAMHKNANIHIKLDTGMSRIGFAITKESKEIIEQIAKLPGIEIKGCFSHFARMDEKDKTKANEQFAKFTKMVNALEKDGVDLGIRHISNSAGIMEAPEVQMDMVRNGICLYGLYPSEEVQKERLPLKPAMELKAYVSYVKTLEPGVEIGYGGTYTTTKKTRVATIPVGYADGYSRCLSGKGSVLIHGKKAPILGRVCMDQFMVDVTDIDNVCVGDRVTLFGKDGDSCITIEEISAMAHSFNYEFVCDIGKRIPRVYYRHGKVIETKDYYPDY
ncbi:alanine racemase [Jutongia hominis]|uniref:Alanine racemase n=1 Tax=Jutongia hominis TaxID=2763664 RepID=A0ABR7MTI6_9FIRM|nr:alanine racemase [Jutongia hominis]MBC8557100.1 alanine racemase [Jutongia hominis]